MQIERIGTNTVNDHFGLVSFAQPVSFTQTQITMANGYNEILTIDWGDFQRHGWNALSSKITKIDAKTLMLRNNRYSAILKELTLIKFPNLKEINARSNKIVSLESLQKFDLPNLRELDLSENYIVSTKSLVKGLFPMLRILRLQFNPLIDNSRLFQGLFPKLAQIAMDCEFVDRGTNYRLFWSNPVTWRIKNAPRLVGDNNKRGFVNRRDMDYGGYMDYMGPEQQEQQVERPLNCEKYYDMLQQKPNYFKEPELL